jgi:hypothetical protein
MRTKLSRAKLIPDPRGTKRHDPGFASMKAARDLQTHAADTHSQEGADLE